MKTQFEIQEEISDLRDELDGIIDVAEKAGRDLTAKESKRVLAICDDEIPARHTTMKALVSAQKDRKERAGAKLGSALDRQMAENGYHVSGSGAQWKQDSRGRGYQVLAKGDKLSRESADSDNYDAAHFILAKCFGAQKGTPPLVRGAMTSNDNGLGGFLVPDPLMPGFHDLARADSVLVQAGITQIQMDSDTLTVPALEADGTVHATGESQTIQDSDMTFGSRQLSTHKLAMLIKLSRELYEDATELAARQLQLAMTSKMAERIDYFGLRGTGSGEPLGILNWPSIPGTGSIGAISFEDLAQGVLDIREANRRPTAMIMSPLVDHDLSLLTTGDGTNSAKGWLASPDTVRDKSRLVTSNCPDDKMIIGDFMHYCMGVRNRISVEATTVGGDAFADHQIWIKVWARVAYVPLDLSAFNVLSGITS